MREPPGYRTLATQPSLWRPTAYWGCIQLNASIPTYVMGLSPADQSDPSDRAWGRPR